MKLKGIFAAMLLVVAGVQTAAAQGFRVYKSDGTIMQFSLRTDSIVFYDGRMIKELAHEEINEQDVMLYSVGVTQKTAGEEK